MPGEGLELAHRRWRAAVAADEDNLRRARMKGPLWYPVPLDDGIFVLPVYGGTPAAVEQLATTLVMSGLESGVANCRVVNLSGWDVSADLKNQMQPAKRNTAQFEEIGPGGSTASLFGNPDAGELVALVVDSLRGSSDRNSARQSQQERLELERVVRLLRGRATVARMVDAVSVALGASSAGTTLTVDETRDLQDYFAVVTGQRRATQDRLSDLLADLEAIARFDRAPGRQPERVGSGPTSVRWFDVAPGRSTDEVELGRQLLARAVLQAFGRAGTPELLVVLGADRLADEVRDELVAAAQRARNRVVLVYTQLSAAGQRMLGYAGSPMAVFMRLPNPSDATAAAEFLGREYKFVVNGISIAEGQTQEWSNSFGTSTSRSTSRTSTSSSSSGYAGAFNFSRSVGSSVTSSFERGTSTTTTSGASRSTTSTTSSGRVHEFVLEPEVFQQMPEDLMLVVGNGTVVVASCQNRLRWSKQTSRQKMVALP